MISTLSRQHWVRSRLEKKYSFGELSLLASVQITGTHRTETCDDAMHPVLQRLRKLEKRSEEIPCCTEYQSEIKSNFIFILLGKTDNCALHYKFRYLYITLS